MVRILFAVVVGTLLSATVRADDLASYKALAAASAAASPGRVERYGGDALRRGELRLPAGPGPFPVAVLVHGGCWDAATGGISDMAPLADALTKRGIATWSIEYRRVGDPGGGWPGTFADVAAGVDHVRALAGATPLDLSRLAFVGHSSGAHLALWAASRPKLDDPVAGHDPLRPTIVVAIDGPAALAPFIGVDTEVCGKPAIVPLMGGTPEAKPAAYRTATPADHLPLGVRQLLVLGEFKPLMMPYAAAARASGDTVDVVALDGADHFNVIDPATAIGRATVEAIVAHLPPVH